MVPDSWAITIPVEVVATSIVISYWGEFTPPPPKRWLIVQILLPIQLSTCLSFLFLFSPSTFWALGCSEK